MKARIGATIAALRADLYRALRIRIEAVVGTVVATAGVIGAAVEFL